MCRYPFIASEVLSCEIPGVSKIMLDDANTLLGPFWDAMLSADALFQRGPVPLHEHPLTMGAYTGEKQDDEASDKKRMNLQSNIAFLPEHMALVSQF